MPDTEPRRGRGRPPGPPSDVRCSIRYRTLLTALRNLDNSAAASMAFQEVYGPEYQHAWATRNGGLKLVQSGRICVHRLSRTYPRCSGYDEGCQPPGNEHGSLWAWDRRPVVYVYQPCCLTSRDARELAEYCQKMKLDFSIDSRLAWHSPGNVLLIELWRKDFDRNQLLKPQRKRVITPEESRLFETLMQRGRAEKTQVDVL